MHNAISPLSIAFGLKQFIPPPEAGRLIHTCINDLTKVKKAAYVKAGVEVVNSAARSKQISKQIVEYLTENETGTVRDVTEYLHSKGCMATTKGWPDG